MLSSLLREMCTSVRCVILAQMDVKAGRVETSLLASQILITATSMS